MKKLILLALFPILAWSQIAVKNLPVMPSATSSDYILDQRIGSTYSPGLLSMASLMTYIQANYTPPSYTKEYSIYNYGAVCNGVVNDTTAIQAAISAASATGGYVTGYGTCLVSTTLLITSPFVVLMSKEFGDGSHGVGSNDNGWVLKWSGASSGTMATITATAGASNQAIWGNGAQGITFDCNNVAGTGLLLQSAKGGTYNGLYFLECTTAGLDTVPLGLGQLGEARDVQQNTFISTRARTYLSTGVGIRLRGAVSANTSFDTFIGTQIVHKNGTALQIQNTDNLHFVDTQIVQASGGSGIGIEITGDSTGSANSIFFWDPSPGVGGITIRGTETLSTAVRNVQFVGLDVSNGAASPTVGTGVTGIMILKENGHISGSGMVNGTFAGTDSDLTTAMANQAANHPNTSIYAYNGAQDGINLDDGTGVWTLRQDASHNFNIVRNAGTGGVTINSSLSVTGYTGLAVTVVGSLPTCNAGAKGEIYMVTDANAPTYNATLTGGSTTTTLAACNGTNWTAH